MLKRLLSVITVAAALAGARTGCGRGGEERPGARGRAGRAHRRAPAARAGRGHRLRDWRCRGRPQGGGVLSARLKALGMTIESVAAEEPGLAENTVATLTGRGKTRILMIGHIDTVFETGTAQRRPFRTDGERAYGPGVSDEKGGVVEGIHALGSSTISASRTFGKIVFLMETSEERGSPGTRALIGKLLKDADVELNLEPGDLPDTLTVWRKGSDTFRIEVKGRAAHAGIAPQEGRNAALELIHQISGLDVFPKSGDGLTANLTVMHAGTRGNIIPEDAWAHVNVRVRDKADFERVAQVLRKNAETTVIPDTRVTVAATARVFRRFPTILPPTSSRRGRSGSMPASAAL